MIPKIHGYTGVDDGEMRLLPEQEETILRTIEEFTEGSHGVLWGSDMDTGKTVQACEVIVRMGFKFALFIGVKDTYADINARLESQSDGAMTLRRIDATKPGKANLAAMLAGEDGLYFSGSQFLTAQDWTHVQSTETVTFDGIDREQGIWKRDKQTGAVITREPKLVETLLPVASGEIGPWAVPTMMPMIGPQALPSPVTERVHLHTFKKMKRAFDVIVFDEIHVIANRKAIGRITLISMKVENRLAMSGTWMGNKFENSWSITRWTNPDVVPRSFHAWKSEYCATGMVDVGRDPETGGRKEREQITGELIPGAFVDSLPCYIRLESPTGEVPAPQVIPVDLSEKQREQYEDLERDLMVWIQSKQAQGLMPLVTELPVTLRMRLRTAALGELAFDEDGEIGFAPDCQSSKLQALGGILNFWRGEQVAVYTHSKRFAKLTVARLRAAGYNAVEYSGDVSSKGRDEIKRQFLAGEVQIIVAVIAAFNAGLDGFQKVCNKVVWLSEDENNVLNNQAIKRFWRRGHADGFVHVKLIARHTHDEGIFNSLITQTLARNAEMRAPRQIGLAA